ncbi:CARDB domain-containing protein [Enhygromyxa salina]|uniref:CARDB domain-containing protein n=1 Tax=Enhygromyxa salina TaxID=215803 RepID=A0A2S9XTS0_9BACT|nr:CARDB domain-containing protein [Enhygromyxa salina]PRP96234.1 hypothetical protein ENSA7_70480 [Enhygromyxa salina]
MNTKLIASTIAVCTLLLPATALAAPDLIVSDIDANYDAATDLITFEITVKNNGTSVAASSFWVDIFGAEKGNWDECAEVDWDWALVQPGLAPGAEEQVVVEMDRDYTTLGAVYFFVDIDQRVVEASEINNEGQALVLATDPNEPRVAIGNFFKPNPECLQDAVFDALGIVIPDWAQMFFAKLRII